MRSLRERVPPVLHVRGRRIGVGRHRPGGRLRVAEPEHGERVLAHAVDMEDLVQRGVDEPHVQARPQVVRSGERQKVGEHRARVPPHMPVAALEVLPPRAPVDAGQDHEVPRGRRPRRRPRPRIARRDADEPRQAGRSSRGRPLRPRRPRRDRARRRSNRRASASCRRRSRGAAGSARPRRRPGAAGRRRRPRAARLRGAVVLDQRRAVADVALGVVVCPAALDVLRRRAVVRERRAHAGARWKSYSPNSSRRTPEISPTVQWAASAARMAGRRFSVERPTRRTSSSARAASPRRARPVRARCAPAGGAPPRGRCAAARSPRRRPRRSGSRPPRRGRPPRRPAPRGRRRPRSRPARSPARWQRRRRRSRPRARSARAHAAPARASAPR